MKIALVNGSTISTIKDENLNGNKLLVVRETDTYGKPTGDPYIAYDTVSAGKGDLVVVVTGSSAHNIPITKDSPVDAIIAGVIHSLEESCKVTSRKELGLTSFLNRYGKCSLFALRRHSRWYHHHRNLSER